MPPFSRRPGKCLSAMGETAQGVSVTARIGFTFDERKGGGRRREGKGRKGTVMFQKITSGRCCCCFRLLLLLSDICQLVIVSSRPDACRHDII